MRADSSWSPHGLLIALGLLVSLALPSAASAACAPGATLAAYDDEAAMLSGGGGAFVQSSQWVAQSFVVPNTNVLGSVSLFMKNEAPAGDSVTAELRSDAGGMPGALLGLAAASTANTTTYDWLVFDFSGLGIQLAGGTPYWIVATNPITTDFQGYTWQETGSPAAYPSGISRTSQNQGSSWGGATSSDFGFRVLGCASPATPPANAFSLGKLKRDTHKGTATITVNVPNPGELTGSGNGVNASSAGTAVISKSVGAGQTKLLIKANGKKKRKLNETGKVKLNVAITYTPTGGDPSTQSIKVILKKEL